MELGISSEDFARSYLRSFDLMKKTKPAITAWTGKANPKLGVKLT
jgi:hypothetical protein